ncbi:MAG: FKBP-type peptidyl-prolyl cis-trans isomerase [Treponema sp.]|jgi:FKBP-type peptidyl-prolyl cis-trans isomerase|nr:FKBP-type peptidyl-prolyl cis-trans isomerase [Treponema sp.]
MKKALAFLCLFLSVLALHARAIQEDYRRAEEKARVSYAFGMIIGNNLSTAGIEFDYDAFTEGVKALLEENALPQFSEQEAREIVETALQESMDRQSAQNRLLEEEFLAKNMRKPEIIVTPSGLQYEILTETAGEKPNPDSIVRVRYTGTFSDGNPFDSSTEEDGAYIPLDMVIPGWTEGVMLMSVGSSYRLFIPSNLAYGREGIRQIVPPYSTLIFTVELLEIISPDAFDFGGFDSVNSDDDFEPEGPNP